MLVVRYALCAPGKERERAANLDAHRAHLRDGTVRVVQSGPLFDAAGREQVGALVVAEVDSPEQMAAFSASDPFVTAGVYASTLVAVWKTTIGP